MKKNARNHKTSRKARVNSARKKLIEAAKNAQKNSYSPYSRYPVGAAVLAESGRIYSGCNVENASFGLACCAERVAIFKAVSHGEKKLRAVCVTAKSAKPCGACRQVIAEFAPLPTVVHMCNRAGAYRDTTVAELVPFIFHLKK